MRIIVSKFGGSSTANAERFVEILGLVRASPARRCIVLSAPGIDDEHGEKVTSLLELCWQNRLEPEGLSAAVSKVVARFRELALGLSLPDVGEFVEREVTEAVGVSLPRVLSRGEYLCAWLFSRWSGIPMADAGTLIAFTDSNDLDEAGTRRNFQALAARERPFVVPGFYGSDPRGRTVTFPRNGSDITGALAAAGMEAGLYENWTDVPGLMTADPAVVPDARLIPQISYRQMRALARAGARVLHPACLDPVSMAGIPTRLRCTMDPASFGTLIDEHIEGVAPCVVGRRAAPLPLKPGVTAACVSVFGVPEAKVRAAGESLGALDVQRSDMAVRVYVEEDRLEHCLRRLHGALI